MAILNIITTHGAVSADDRTQLATELAKLTYEAEGFAGSAIAPTLSWIFFDERPSGGFSTGVGAPQASLYYITVTIMAGVMDGTAKHRLGAGITAALLQREGVESLPDHRNRVWIRFIDVADGDLVIGGEPGSLADLKALVAAGQH